MILVNDIYWAAGFLEGEGCFTLNGVTGSVVAVQVQKEPLVRLRELFGGTLTLRSKQTNPKAQPLWIWSLSGFRATALMMTLYSLMSPKRKEQIKKALDKWKAHLPYGTHRTHCKRGHQFSPTNTRIDTDGDRVCRECHRERGLKYYRLYGRRKIGHSKYQESLQFPNPGNISNE